MRANEQDLTPQLRELLEQHKHEDAKAEARSLHRVVTSKASAKKELTRLRAARASYLQAWTGYLDKVIGTIQQQLEEHDATMADFTLKEGQWEQSLQESATALARLATEADQIETISDAENDAMEASEAKVEASCQAELQAQRVEERSIAASTQSQTLLAALAAAKANAVEDQQKDQARERTPRRAKGADGAAKKEGGELPSTKKDGNELPPGGAS